MVAVSKTAIAIEFLSVPKHHKQYAETFGQVYPFDAFLCFHVVISLVFR